MLLLIPTYHDRMAVNRLPYVTIFIGALCILVHLYTHFQAPASEERLVEAEKSLLEYFFEHPGLEVPEETMKDLSPELQQLLAQKDEYGSILGLSSETLEDILNIHGNWEAGETDDEEEAEAREKIIQGMNDRIREFEEARAGEYFHIFGYTPSEGGVVNLFTSMFIHGGVMHLLGNLLFLWLAGCAIEDLWGRIIFPVFYLAGGVAASLTHGMIYPESFIPCIGASGAIAAIMGAFAIRMYDARIHMVYVIFYGIRLKHGRFLAPAWVMLILWLLDQLWWGLIYVENEAAGGVAFWAHIGGFGLGAAVALLFKISGLEKRVIEPLVDKKSNLMDAEFSEGASLLDQGDAEGAIDHLRQVLIRNPDHAAARGKLCRAYLLAGRNRLAVLEFKREVGMLMDQGLMEDAAEEFIELAGERPDFILEPDREMRIISEMRSLEKFDYAAWASERYYLQHRENPDMKNHPSLVDALMLRGDILMDSLDRPREAFMTYRQALQSGVPMPDETRNQLKRKGVRAGQAARKQAEEKKKTKKKTPSPPTRKGPAIPLSERIRLVKPAPVPPVGFVGAITHRETGKIASAPGGFDVKLLSHEPVPYDHVCLMTVFALTSRDDPAIFADFFLSGTLRPFRISSILVDYPAFLSDIHSSNLENFRKFLLQVISRTSAVYLDIETLLFIKKGKIRSFVEEADVGAYERTLWHQLIGRIRHACPQCGVARWIDGRKKGGGTTCPRCKTPMVGS